MKHPKRTRHPHDTLWWDKLRHIFSGRTVVMYTVVSHPDQQDTLVIMVTPAP